MKVNANAKKSCSIKNQILFVLLVHKNKNVGMAKRGC